MTTDECIAALNTMKIPDDVRKEAIAVCQDLSETKREMLLDELQADADGYETIIEERQTLYERGIVIAEKAITVARTRSEEGDRASLGTIAAQFDA